MSEAASAWSFRPHQIESSVFVAAGAIILGDVSIGAESSVWFQAVLRGDTDRIRIGSQTNIQDGAIVHCDPGKPCTIGNRVTLGHGAIVHGATVEDDCLIGIRAVVMNGAVIGTGSLVGVGAVVTEGTIVPPNSLVLGLPGKVVRELGATDRERIERAARHYVAAARQCRAAGWEHRAPGHGESAV